MMEPNFQPSFEPRPLENMGAGRFEIGRLEVANLDVLQREVTWKLEEKKKHIETSLQTHRISVDEKAIHERVEKIMGLDDEALDTLEQAVNAKLEEKRRELGKRIKSL